MLLAGPLQRHPEPPLGGPALHQHQRAEAGRIHVAGAGEVDHQAAAALGQGVQQVQAGLARLGDLDRQTLVAFYVNGKSLIEMAIEFDAPVGTIKRRLHVARKRLAKEVEGLMAL